MLNNSLFTQNIVRPSVSVSDVGLTFPSGLTRSLRGAVEVSGPSTRLGSQVCFGGTPTGCSSPAGNRAGVESTLTGILPKRHGLWCQLSRSGKKLLPIRWRLSSQQKQLIDGLNESGVPHVIEDRVDKITIRPSVWVPIMYITEEYENFEQEIAIDRQTVDTDDEVLSVSQESIALELTIASNQSEGRHEPECVEASDSSLSSLITTFEDSFIKSESIDFSEGLSEELSQHSNVNCSELMSISDEELESYSQPKLGSVRSLSLLSSDIESFEDNTSLSSFSSDFNENTLPLDENLNSIPVLTTNGSEASVTKDPNKQLRDILSPGVIHPFGDRRIQIEISGDSKKPEFETNLCLVSTDTESSEEDSTDSEMSWDWNQILISFEQQFGRIDELAKHCDFIFEINIVVLDDDQIKITHFQI